MSADTVICRISANETLPLRHSVLWPKHPVSHVLLPEDALGYHYGAFLPGTVNPVAVISVFVDPLPSTSDAPSTFHDTMANAARFRKFACDPGHQGQGIGTMLLKHVFDAAVSVIGCGVVWCDARTSAAGWYERRGMIKFGDIFYKGDISYVRMKRELVTTVS